MSGILAEEGLLFLGEDFLPWIVLALGAAMVAGNALAILRPPSSRSAHPETASPETSSPETAEQRPPLLRALVMIGIGSVASIWGIASLVS
ncbi:MAG: hypothetical protein WD029_00540 [Microthrixaceae bacterium]